MIHKPNYFMIHTGGPCPTSNASLAAAVDFYYRNMDKIGNFFFGIGGERALLPKGRWLPVHELVSYSDGHICLNGTPTDKIITSTLTHKL